MSDATDSLLTGIFNSLPGLIQGGANYVGAGNVASDIVQGNQNAINTQQGIQTQLQNIYNPQVTLGNQADVALGSLFGVNGQAPNYSSFMNQPGYQFTLDQGTKAINRQAAATGSLYTPQTLQQVGSYAEGVASQQYNNYVQQLLQSAGLGAQGNQGLANGIYGTGANISQAQINQGNANASGAASKAGAVGSTLSGLPYGNILSSIGNLFRGGAPGSSNASGILSGAGNILNGAGSLFGGGMNGAPNYSDYNPVTGAGNWGSNLFDNFQSQSGYNPVTGDYGTPSGVDFSSFAQNGGYNPVTGEFSSGDQGLSSYQDLFGNPQ